MKKILFLVMAFALAACNTGEDRPYNETDFAMGGPDAPLYNERTSQFMQADNQFAEVDSWRPFDAQEKEANDKKWNSARMETRWREYRGTMVRVEILLGNTDMREMRLRLMQSADGMDINTNQRGVLAQVADYEMKRVCGRNVDNIVIVYDQPSFEVMRPTPYFEYRVEAEGATMREIGFRCVYRD